MDKETFGKFIANMRREKNMTQHDLAGQLHVTNTAVSKWERGISYPDLSLFESLAQVLGLTVSELMACQKSAKEEASVSNLDGHVRSLLDIIKDTTRSHRRQALLLGSILLLAAVLISSVVYHFSVFAVREIRYAELMGKQADEDSRYVYVEKDMHLLRLECPDQALYDSLQADGRQLYHLEYRYNRNTYQGTLDACQALSEDVFLGSPMNEAGSAWIMDNSLFGFNDVVQKIEYVMEDPIREGKYLYTFCFHYQKPTGKQEPDTTAPEAAILRVENCRAALPYDYDDDGVQELFVLTRYEEAPYRLYDLEAGKLISRFVAEVPEQVLESLKIMAFDSP